MSSEHSAALKYTTAEQRLNPALVEPYNGLGPLKQRKQVSRESIYSNILPQHDLEFRLFPVCGSSDIRRTLRSVRWPHRTSCGLPDVAEAHPDPSCRPRAPPASSSCPGNRNSRFKVRGQFNVYIMTSYQTPTYLPHRCRCPTPQLSSPPVHTMSEVGETALSSHSHRQTCPQQRSVTY